MFGLGMYNQGCDLTIKNVTSTINAKNKLKIRTNHAIHYIYPINNQIFNNNIEHVRPQPMKDFASQFNNN